MRPMELFRRAVAEIGDVSAAELSAHLEKKHGVKIEPPFIPLFKATLQGVAQESPGTMQKSPRSPKPSEVKPSPIQGSGFSCAFPGYNTDMMDDLKKLIQKRWGYSTLRPLQEDAMRAVLDGRDSLLVLPTGGSVTRLQPYCVVLDKPPASSRRSSPS